ncbi:MAG: hypothetical protein IJB52_14125 [Clostridia bacterium]|nr:hypothetical protein [Clostridia bacterium]
MSEKPQKRKKRFLNKPFDLNRNGKIDPAEMALIMMIIADVKVEKQKQQSNTINAHIFEIDDMDIEGI